MHKSKRKLEVMEKVKIDEVVISLRAVCNKRGVQHSELRQERLMREEVMSVAGLRVIDSIIEDEEIERLTGLLNLKTW